MKDLTNILRRSKITPYERVKIMLENSLHIEETGEDLLCEADLIAISENWTPKNREEVSQYNRYLRIVKNRMKMYLDAKMFYLQSENSILHVQGLIDYVKTRDLDNLDFDKLGINNTDEEKTENLNYLFNNTSFSYSCVLQNKTFLSLPKDVQDDLLLLDEAVYYDSRYLGDHILLYEIYKESDSLSENQKEIIFNKIYSRIKQKGSDDQINFNKYEFFAEIPSDTILCHCADQLKIKYDKTDNKYWENITNQLNKYASEKNISIELIIRKIIYEWIDNGLFEKEYTLLYKSKNFETWTKPTKLNHSELFFIWYKKLKETKSELDRLFNIGDLIKDGDTITGSSLYNSESTEDFVLEYKEQINSILPYVSIYKFIKENNDPIKCYKTLEGFVELSKKFSEIFEVDASKAFVKFKDNYATQILLLNYKLARIIDSFYENHYKNKKWAQVIEINPNACYFDINEECDPIDIINTYSDLMDENNN